MDETIVFNNNLVNLNTTSTNWETVLASGVDLMINEGLVEEIYKQQVIERERQFPTAIEFPDVTVALAHGDPIGVNTSAMAILRCVDKPEFGQMIDPDMKSKVDVVILLAVNNPNSHIKVLANLMNALANETICTMLKESEDKERIVEVLNEELLRRENNE